MALREVAAGTGVNGDEQPMVDIIAVHGLNPLNHEDHYLDTWRKPRGNTGKLWLRDHLPEVAPNARILLYKYNSNPVFAASKQRFIEHANNLLERIHVKRDSDPLRPIILVAHSLGGILIKQALVNARNNPRYEGIKSATTALVFFGTPHGGGKDFHVALGNASIRIVRGVFRSPPNDILEAVKTGSLYSEVLQDNWRHQLNLYKIVSFWEERENVVPKESATIGLPGNVENEVRIDAGHSDMCRFDLSVEEDQDNYEVVQANMKELYIAALRRHQAVGNGAVALDLPSVPTGIMPRLVDGNGPVIRSTSKVLEGRPSNPGGLFGRMSQLGGSFPQDQLMKKLRSEVPSVVDMCMEAYVKSFFHYKYQLEFRHIAHERYMNTSAGVQTCTWISRHPMYQSWESSNEPCVLWLTGSTGLGKSVLSAYIVRRLDTLARNREGKEESKVVWSFSDSELNGNASSVIAVVIHQLIKYYPNLRDFAYGHDEIVFGGIFKSHFVKARNRPVKQLWELLCDIINFSSWEKVFLVVDGLHECDEASQMQLIQLFSDASPKMRILVSSRPGTAASAEFSKWPDVSDSTLVHLDVDETPASTDLEKDLDQYTMDQTPKLRLSCGFSVQQELRINEHLRRDHSATFLSVRIILKGLEHVQPRILSSFLKRSSHDLPTLYRSLLDDVPDTVRQKTKKALIWLSYARTPLTVKELACACHQLSLASTATGTSLATYDSMTKEYLGSFRDDLQHYSPLLTFREAEDIVKFVHPSAKEFYIEYLKNLSPSPESLYVQPRAAQQEIAITCLQLLISKSSLIFPATWSDQYLRTLNHIFDQNTLLEYAFRNWYKHVQDSTANVYSLRDVDPHLMSLMHTFARLWKDPKTINFRRLLMMSSHLDYVNQKEDLNPFELASALGLTGFVLFILDQGLDESPNYFLSDTVGPALSLAIRGGHETTVFTIIERLHITSLDGPAFAGILAGAAMSNHPNLLRRLLKMRRKDHQEILGATDAAFARGNWETMEALIEEASFEGRDNWGMTSLHRLCFDAAWDRGKLDSKLAQAYFLIEHERVKPEARDKMGNTALHYACWNHYGKDFLKGLIEIGADPRIVNRYKRNSFHLAARYATDTETIDFLLEVGGADLVGSKTRGGMTPLHWATQRHGSGAQDENVAILRTLLLRGADPNTPTLYGVTPLQMAQETGRWSLWTLQSVYTRLEGVHTTTVRPPARIPTTRSAFSQSPVDEDLDIRFGHQFGRLEIRNEVADDEEDMDSGFAKGTPESAHDSYFIAEQTGDIVDPMDQRSESGTNGSFYTAKDDVASSTASARSRSPRGSTLGITSAIAPRHNSWQSWRQDSERDRPRLWARMRQWGR